MSKLSLNCQVRIGEHWFATVDEAEMWAATNICGTYAIVPMAWCDDCADWVDDDGQCGQCGAPPYDETRTDTGLLGFRGGVGKEAWAALQQQRRAELTKLRAWNKGLPYSSGGK